MDDVFISYARETGSTARAAAEAIRAAGHSVWMDDRIPAHREYADVISERIDSAKAVLVIWSDAAARSQWVRSEANRARESGKLVQLRIDGTRLPMPFDQIQCVDLPNWPHDIESAGWKNVLASIGALAGSIAAVEPVVQLTPSLAVIPFKDLSAAQDQGYFCDGMAEEILVSLARLPGLRVASPAVVSATNRSQGSHELARALGVTNLLEGSVRKADDRARIAVRLVEVPSGFTLWAESFDRELADTFALQEEIARAVVGALGVKLLPQNEPGLAVGGSSVAEAYDLYLRARALVRKELETERRAAAELFRQAIRRDDRFALAHAALADVLTEIARVHPPDWQHAQTEALAASDLAVQLAPALAEAHLARGSALRLEHDPAAGREFELAVELSPHDANVHYRYARFLVLEGRKEEAIAHYEKAFALAPDDYRCIVYTIQEYQALGDEDGEQRALGQAAAVIEHHLKINPEDVRALGHGAGVMALLGRKDDCHSYIERAMRLRPDDFGNLANLACASVLNGEFDRALDLLEAAVAGGRGDREWLMQDNDYKPLHGHPRFDALVERMS
jgi:adenylate cyclase